MKIMDKYYTINEVSKMFNLSTATIRKLIIGKKIRAVNISAGNGIRANWRLLKGDIDRYIAEQHLLNYLESEE